jgi:hypothetical protein
MQNPEYARILAEENLELTDTQTKFVERIDELTEVDDIDEYLTIDQLEAQLLELESNTKKIYLDMARRLLANADERKLIEAKKANLGRKG